MSLHNTLQLTMQYDIIRSSPFQPQAWNLATHHGSPESVKASQMLLWSDSPNKSTWNEKQIMTIDGLWFVILDGQGDMFRFKILVFDSIWFGFWMFPGFLSGASWGPQHVLLWENLHLLEVSWKLGHMRDHQNVTPVLQAFLERNGAENHAHLEEIVWTKSEPRQHAYPKSSESSKTATTNATNYQSRNPLSCPYPASLDPLRSCSASSLASSFHDSLVDQKKEKSFTSRVVQSFFKQDDFKSHCSHNKEYRIKHGQIHWQSPTRWCRQYLRPQFSRVSLLHRFIVSMSSQTSLETKTTNSIHIVRFRCSLGFHVPGRSFEFRVSTLSFEWKLAHFTRIEHWTQPMPRRQKSSASQGVHGVQPWGKLWITCRFKLHKMSTEFR